MPRTVQVFTRPVRLSTPLLFAVLALAACKGTETPEASGPADIGGTLVIATPGDAHTMLPMLVADITSRQVTDLVFDRLAEIGPDLNSVSDKGFTPQLAERWEWAPDSLSIAFFINPKAMWHDGRPVRASDVRYSFSLAKNPTLGSAVAPLIVNMDSVTVRDSLTAVAWYKQHLPEQFYDFVYQVLIVPEHILGNTPPDKLADADVVRRAVGSGQFKLAKWEPGARIELLADTANYRGRPKLDRVVFSISPDFTAAVTRFMSGDADIFENLRPEHLAKLVGDTARRAMPYRSLGYAYVVMNSVDPKMPTRPHPVFGERAVRRALTMAIDRRAMLRNVFDTIGRPLYGPFPSGISVADTGLPQLPYDTVKARALLDSAGWVPGADGIRVKNGRRLEFGVSVPSSSAPRKQYAVLLQEAFRKVGAAANIEEADFGAFSEKQSKRLFDAEIAQFNTDPSVSGFKQSWSTSAIKPGGSNYGSYSNAMVDALLDSSITSFDPARTKAYARRAFETIIEDAPAIWLYESSTIAGVHRRLRTVPTRADGWWSGLAQWSIPASQRSARDKIGLRPTP